MNFVRLLPVFISGLLMGAHFLYHGSVVLAVACVAFPLILMFKKKWAARAVQVYLLVATAEWLRTLVVIARVRIENDEPWGRMCVILCGVAAFTLLSACVFFAKTLKDRYELN